MGVLRAGAAAAVLFALAGVATSPLSEFVRGRFHSEGAAGIGEMRAGAPLFALLGGYRSLIADFVWIKAYIDWERKNYIDCLAALELATSLDPETITFWTQGASIIAFDTPHWLIARSAEKIDAEMEKSIRRRQAKIALKFLDRGIAAFPDEARLWLTKGQIYIIALSDYKGAQDCYAKIVDIYGNDAPVYILRIYAALLARNGHFGEAADALKRVLSQLEPDSPIKATVERDIKRAEELQKKASAD
ncbi:MAG: hypothetical protein DBX55_08815 [Verrucomicrobia bacterium]|nr:MAG: hypothetical protein DBX55_08815 [Verrucomicrobiota bacterium]